MFRGIHVLLDLISPAYCAPRIRSLSSSPTAPPLHIFEVVVRNVLI